MLEKGSINLGLVASIVLALVVGYLIISLFGKVTSRRATAADPATEPVVTGMPAQPQKVGFQQATTDTPDAPTSPEPTDPVND